MRVSPRAARLRTLSPRHWASVLCRPGAEMPAGQQSSVWCHPGPATGRAWQPGGLGGGPSSPPAPSAAWLERLGAGLGRPRPGLLHSGAGRVGETGCEPGDRPESLWHAHTAPFLTLPGQALSPPALSFPRLCRRACPGAVFRPDTVEAPSPAVQRGPTAGCGLGPTFSCGSCFPPVYAACSRIALWVPPAGERPLPAHWGSCPEPVSPRAPTWLGAQGVRLCVRECRPPLRSLAAPGLGSLDCICFHFTVVKAVLACHGQVHNVREYPERSSPNRDGPAGGFQHILSTELLIFHRWYRLSPLRS